MKVTILGCGTSGGVPRLPGDWGACDPANPKNRRRRVSVLVESATTTVLIDTSPDMRAQLLDAGVERLDAVLYTHDHADHTHGIDDLRPYYQLRDQPVDIYADAQTLAILKQRFDYIFAPKGGYPAIAAPHEIAGPFRVGDLNITPFSQQHGPVDSLGFRINNIAYSTDLNGLSDEAFQILDGVDLWIVDALRYRPHPTHAHLDLTLSWIARVQPRRAILTHMTQDMDYETLKAELPAGVEPGFDGMVIETGTA